MLILVFEFVVVVFLDCMCCMVILRRLLGVLCGYAWCRISAFRVFCVVVLCSFRVWWLLVLVLVFGGVLLFRWVGCFVGLVCFTSVLC